MKKHPRVTVWHPEYKANATPLKEDLEAWLKKGWQKVPAKPPVEPVGEEK